MVKYENSEYVPCDYKVIIQNRGQEEIHYTNSKIYWKDMVAKHDHLTNLSFEEITLTAEQNERLAEINEENIQQGFQAQVREYVENGNFPEGYNHPLSDLKQRKEKKQYDNELDNAYQMILENEGLI